MIDNPIWNWELSNQHPDGVGIIITTKGKLRWLMFWWSFFNPPRYHAVLDWMEQVRKFMTKEMETRIFGGPMP